MRKLIVCTMQRHRPHASCGPSGGVALACELEAEIARRGMSVLVERKNCLGACLDGPNVRLFPDGRYWRHATSNSVPDIIAYLDEIDQSKRQGETTWTSI